ncbi:MAG: hypothetical protein ACRD1X_08315 [Vicinamibacteria bacterium]
MIARLVPYLRTTLGTAGIFVALGLSRHVDAFVRVFLRQETGQGFLSAMGRNLHFQEGASEILTVVGFGLSLWLAVSLLLFWLSDYPLEELLRRIGRSMVPLLLPACFTTLACLSLMVSPQFPYGANLVLTLAYEGSFAPLLAWGLCAISLTRTVYDLIDCTFVYDSLAPERWPWYRLGEAVIPIVALGIFALATPSWLWTDGEGQGNMFKYLRMAAAFSASGDLDIAKAEGAAEQASFAQLLSILPRTARGWMDESYELAGAIADSAGRGRVYVGDVVATRANRSMFRSPNGGIYYINAPGPGLLLVPAYLTDRALNRWLGWNRQVAAILFWNLLGALLVLEMFRCAREVELGWGAATFTAFALALSPPLLPYTYQVYPELPAALFLLYAFRRLLVEPAPSGWGLLAGAFALAGLPWLHQKYAVTAALMAVMGAWRVVGTAPGRSDRLARLLLFASPLALSALSLTVYNHALTGSVLPDATFRAAGRSAFEPGNLLSGFLGLFVDAENGLFVYAPVYVLSLAGLGRLALRHREIRSYLLAVVLSYVFVIASFPHWPGAVSSVARYILSVAPLAAIPLVFVARRSAHDGVLAGAASVFLAGTLSFSFAFQKDLVASHVTRTLLDRTRYSDPLQYLPSFLSEGPAHFYQLGAMAVAIVLVWYLLTPRVEQESHVREHEAAMYPWKALMGSAALVGLIFVMGGLLERVPANTTARTGPVENDTHPLRRTEGVAQMWVEGAFPFEERGVWVPGARTARFFIRSPDEIAELRVALINTPAVNEVRIAQRGSEPLSRELAPSAREVVDLPLRRPYLFEGPEGRRYIYELAIRSRGSFVPRDERTGDDKRRLGCFVVLSAM